MKIAVFGWYGHNNAGDERIKFCLNHFLTTVGGINTVDFYDLHAEAIQGKTSKFDSYNLVIIGGGGLILSQHNYHDFILGIKTKIVTLGVSVETQLKGNPKKFSQALIDKSTMVLVRDKESTHKLKNLDPQNKVKNSVDLTFLKPYEVATRPTEQILGINFLAKTMHSHSTLRFRLLLARFSRHLYPKPVCFKGLIQELQQHYQLLPIPLYCDKQNIEIPVYQYNDINFMKQYFDQVPNKFNSEDIDKCAILLSMRLHGLIFAAQKGIPFLTFSIYPKQINFLRETGTESNTIDINELNSVKNKLDALELNLDNTRNKIIAYRAKAIESIQCDMIELLNRTLK